MSQSLMCLPGAPKVWEQPVQIAHLSMHCCRIQSENLRRWLKDTIEDNHKTEQEREDN